jgi:phosphoserine phosphatase
MVMIMTGCNQSAQQPDLKLQEDSRQVDPLPSWNDGEVKTAIKDFVESASTEGPGFIPVNERIATFDNDGTLWAEKPVYFQLIYAMDKIRDMADDHPEWKTTQPFKAVLENDMEALAGSGMEGLMQLIMTSHTGMTTSEFEESVTQWIGSATHPETGKLYSEMIYQPMLELLDYLRANDFKTFIVSGGGIEFMRPWVEETYGIPRDQVVGSSIKTEYVYENGVGRIKRKPEIDFIDDKAGKPVGIWRFIGRKPVFAGGNSDGDLQMLQFTTSEQPSFALYIHHTDSIREWAYDQDSHVGRLDAGLEEAKEKGWTVVSMKDDWNTVFPGDLK